MLEEYISFFAAHKIAAVVFVLQLGIRPVWKYFDLNPSENDRAAWVDRYKALPNVLKGILDGVVLTANSLMAEWWILNVAMPGLSGSPASVLAVLFQSAIGIGLGLSMGKALTETDYSWYKR